MRLDGFEKFFKIGIFRGVDFQGDRRTALKEIPQGGCDDGRLPDIAAFLNRNGFHPAAARDQALESGVQTADVLGGGAAAPTQNLDPVIEVFFSVTREVIRIRGVNLP